MDNQVQLSRDENDENMTEGLNSDTNIAIPSD